MVENSKFDRAFLDHKRRQLLQLRQQLSGTRQSHAAAEGAANGETETGGRGFEDDAQKLTTLELEGTLIARDDARLANVERALRKLDEGTYGVSDASGKAIPADRLNAVPEAVYTLDEQQERDAAR